MDIFEEYKRIKLAKQKALSNVYTLNAFLEV